MPSAREGKVERVAQWLAARGLGWADVEATFYSDSTNDLPLLEAVDHPVATNPDDAAARHRRANAAGAYSTCSRTNDQEIHRQTARQAQRQERPSPASASARKSGPQEHGIDPALVDERALNVVHTLKEAGFEAYIVGGAVRDLLVGLRPKDFDVATSATPEQVKGLFRRAFIIGRRFRIVHVVYGRGREHEVIEVSTFRAYMDNAAAEQVAGNEKTSKSELAGMKHAVDSTGRVLRDNVWGPQEEDATRRDFTINAMYYDPETQTVVDYHGGIKDAKKRTIRMIGDPLTRYREDPVRIIRAVRFAAKLNPLGFKLEPKTAAPLVRVPGAAGRRAAKPPVRRDAQAAADRPLAGHHRAAQGAGHGARHLSAARRGGRARRAALRQGRLAGHRPPRRRKQAGGAELPAGLRAVVRRARRLGRSGWRRKQHPFPALQDAIDDVFNARIGDVSGRGKLAADMREIWMMQPRFEKRTGNTPFSLVEQPRFRAGFDFMRLRADVGEVDVVLADWWQEFSQASDAVREDLVAQLREEQHKGQRRVRAPRPADRPAEVSWTGWRGVPAERRSDASAPAKQASRAARRAAQAPPPPPQARRRGRRQTGAESASRRTRPPSGACAPCAMPLLPTSAWARTWVTRCRPCVRRSQQSAALPQTTRHPPVLALSHGAGRCRRAGLRQRGGRDLRRV